MIYDCVVLKYHFKNKVINFEPLASLKLDYNEMVYLRSIITTTLKNNRIKFCTSMQFIMAIKSFICITISIVCNIWFAPFGDLLLLVGLFCFIMFFYLHYSNKRNFFMNLHNSSLLVDEKYKSRIRIEYGFNANYKIKYIEVRLSG